MIGANDRLLSEAKDVGGPADTADDRFTVYDYGPDANSDGHDDWTQQTDKTMYQGSNSAGTLLEHDSYTYNLQGRMASSDVDLTGSGGGITTTSYEYDDQGVRTSQTIGVTKTVYLYDSQNPTGHAQILEEKNASGAVTKTYTLGLDIIAQQATGVAGDAALYLLKDGHGNTRALANASGAIITGQVFAYDAFGNRLDSATALTTILYSGEQIDSTGLSYNLNRYYRAATGTFTTMDSYAGDTQSPQSLHKYLYTHADPVNFDDPSGRDGEMISMMVSMNIGSSIGSLLNGTTAQAGDMILDSLEEKQANFSSLYFQMLITGAPIAGVLLSGAMRAVDSLSPLVKDMTRGLRTDLPVVNALVGQLDDLVRSGRIRSFTANNFSESALKIRGLTKAAVAGQDAHHVFPVKYEKDFRRLLGADFPDFNINNPIFSYFWDESAHRSNWSAYNNRWQDFFEKNPVAKLDDVLQFGRDLMKDFGFHVDF